MHGLMTISLLLELNKGKGPILSCSLIMSSAPLSLPHMHLTLIFTVGDEGAVRSTCPLGEEEKEEEEEEEKGKDEEER